MKTNRNFTLVELLIVVAIIAILASMLLPALRSAINQARSIQCTSNLKQLGTSHAIYMQDNNDYLMGVTWSGLPYKKPDGSETDGLPTYWNGYMVTVAGLPFDTLFCPEMLSRYTTSNGVNIKTFKRTVKYYPPKSGTWESFGYGKNKAAGIRNPGDGDTAVQKSSQMIHPSTSILLGETAGKYAVSGADGDAKMSHMISYQDDGANQYLQLYPYHNNRCNLLYVDGHAGSASGRIPNEIHLKLGGFIGYGQLYTESNKLKPWCIFKSKGF